MTRINKPIHHGFIFVKIEQKKEAIRLRIEEELSIKEIAKRTGLSVATVSIACREYPLSETRMKELASACNRQKGADENKRKALERRNNARRLGEELVRSNADFRDLCLLYWGEGRKTYTGFSIANSDAGMLAFIHRILKQNFPESKIVSTVYAHEENHISDEELINFWAPILGEIKVYRTKTSRASQRKRIDKLPHGTVHLVINSNEILHKVLGGIEYIKKGERNETKFRD